MQVPTKYADKILKTYNYKEMSTQIFKRKKTAWRITFHTLSFFERNSILFLLPINSLDKALLST